jgi:glycosyltransferase involved in cell wall biosynthesis
MKVMFVSNLYGDNARGGAEQVVAREAEALAAAGHEVVVVSGERQREVPKGVCLPDEPWLCEPSGTKAEIAAAYAAAAKRNAVAGQPRAIRYFAPNIYFYPDGHEHAYAARFAWHLLDIFNGKSAATLGRILDLERPDAVHTHNLMGLGFMIPALLRRRRIRHVHTVHDVQLLHPSGLLPPSGQVGFFARPPQTLYIALMRRMFGSPSTVLFPSEFLRREHEKRGFFRRSRIEVLRNPAPDVSTAPRAVPLAPSFLFVGQLEAHKGIGLLLDVWQRWVDRGNVTLEIAGDGSMAAEISQRAESLGGVRMLGKLDREAVLAAMTRHSCLVFPSQVIENAPTVIMESFSRGTPVVAAATGGVPELVVDGKTGWLFPPGDGDAFLAALRKAAAAVILPDWIVMFEHCMRAAQESSLPKHCERLLGAYRGEIRDEK